MAQRRKAEFTPLLLEAADAGGLRPPQLRLRVDPPNAAAVVEVSHLRRTVTNLADNWVKHAGQGEVQLHARLREHNLEISLRDYGPGLAPQHLGQITGKYVSLAGSGEASGLGLWIVEQLVRSLGGELQFTSGEGEGLAVRVSLPV